MIRIVVIASLIAAVFLTILALSLADPAVPTPIPLGSPLVETRVVLVPVTVTNTAIATLADWERTMVAEAHRVRTATPLPTLTPTATIFPANETTGDQVI